MCTNEQAVCVRRFRTRVGADVPSNCTTTGRPTCGRVRFLLCSTLVWRRRPICFRCQPLYLSGAVNHQTQQKRKHVTSPSTVLFDKIKKYTNINTTLWCNVTHVLLQTHAPPSTCVASLPHGGRAQLRFANATIEPRVSQSPL